MIHVEDPGTGDPVLLIHSTGMSGRQWRRLEVGLGQRGLRAVVPDLTGHGKSPPWPQGKPFSIQTDLEELAALVAGLPPVHVVGHSYGGFLALNVVRAAPDRVRTLTVIDPVAFGVLDPVADADALATVAGLDFSFDDPERWLRRFVEYWGGPGAWDALGAGVRAEFLRVGWISREGARSLGEDHTPLAAYRAIGCPVRCVIGERSPLAARRVVERLAGALPRATMVTIPGAGHMSPLTHAEKVNAVVYDVVGAPPPSPRAV